MKESNQAGQYHIPKENTQSVEDRIRQVTGQELRRWAHDPNCYEMELCDAELTECWKSAERQPAKAVEESRPSERHDNPFSPRGKFQQMPNTLPTTIIKHLWIIFVSLPFVAALLLFLVGVIK
jgi:hypothetical protein